MIDLDSLLPVTQPRFPEEFLGYLDGTPTWNSATQAWDVDGDVDLSLRNLESIPVPFGSVTGVFSCSYNQVTSLKWSPRHVGRDFDCSSNQLTSLEGGPDYVGGYFGCNNNLLPSLAGAPRQWWAGTSTAPTTSSPP